MLILYKSRQLFNIRVVRLKLTSSVIIKIAFAPAFHSVITISGRLLNLNESFSILPLRAHEMFSFPWQFRARVVICEGWRFVTESVSSRFEINIAFHASVMLYCGYVQSTCIVCHFYRDFKLTSLFTRA